MKLPIYKYLDLSIAHITKSTDVELFMVSNNLVFNSELIVYRKVCGYFVCVPEEIDDIDISNDLKDCLRLAKENDCN